jgi:hypothetical protein
MTDNDMSSSQIRESIQLPDDILDILNKPRHFKDILSDSGKEEYDKQTIASTQIYREKYPMLSQKDVEILGEFHTFRIMHGEEGGITFYDESALSKENFILNNKMDHDIEYRTYMKAELTTLKTEEAYSSLTTSERWAIAYRRWEDFSKEEEEDFWTMFYC